MITAWYVLLFTLAAGVVTALVSLLLVLAYCLYADARRVYKR